MDFNEIEDAYNYVNGASWGTNSAYLDTSTGKIYLRSDIYEIEEDREEIPENAPIVEIPHKLELGIGVNLVRDFVGKHLPQKSRLVDEFFTSPGGCRRLKTFLEGEGLLDQWYKFSNEKDKQALMNWCKENKIDVN